MGTETPKIFVTGATGALGSLVIGALLHRVDAGNVVAGVRTLTGDAAERLRTHGVEMRVADYDKPETLATALDGIDRLLLISSNAVGRRGKQHQNVIDAAKQASVELIAYTSILHADTSPLSLAVEHRETEAALKVSGIPFTLLRNSWYTENYGYTVKPALKVGVYLGSAGDGRSAAASRADYAEAAAVVLSTSGHAGKIYELGGDDPFTLTELCAAVSGIAGEPVMYKDVSEAELREGLLKLGFPEGMAKMFAACDVEIAKGALDDRSHQLSRLIGRPTTSYKQTLRDMLAPS